MRGSDYENRLPDAQTGDDLFPMKGPVRSSAPIRKTTRQTSSGNGQAALRCALSNDPSVWEGVSLHQITGDGSYLTKAEQIYQWVKNTLVESSGQVNGCITFPNGAGGATVPQGSNNAYDAGGFIEATDSLWRATANSGYAADAELTADHFLNRRPDRGE